MDYSTIVAVIFGSIGVCGTLVVCTAKVTSRIISMEGVLLGIVNEVTELKTSQKELHKTVIKHSEECDLDRLKLTTKLDSHASKLSSQKKLLDGLGAE